MICLTHYTRELVQAHARKTWVLPNAVDEVFFTIEPAPAPEPTLLCVGGILPYKNQNELIRCLDPVAAKQNFRLIFLGGANPDRPFCKEFMGLVARRPWCIYKGRTEGNDLREHFRSAHLLVHPSLEDNCPLVILEAMAAGLPAAASRIGGIPDLIDHGVNGLLFDPKDSSQMSGTVMQLLSDPISRKRIADEAKKRAMKCYHPNEIARRHLEIYREVLKRQ